MKSTDISLAAWRRVADLIPSELHTFAREWVEALERGEDALELEWTLWKDLCDMLLEAGIVTRADLKAPKSKAHPVFDALRSWGQIRRHMAAEESAALSPGNGAE